jgi:hypothetical protein
MRWPDTVRGKAACCIVGAAFAAVRSTRASATPADPGRWPPRAMRTGWNIRLAMLLTSDGSDMLCWGGIMADLILGKVSYRRPPDRPVGETVPIMSGHEHVGEAPIAPTPEQTGGLLRFRQRRVAHMCDGSAGEQPPSSLRTLITHLASVPH